MIILITCYEPDKAGKMVEVVSHGVNWDTGRNVCLPCETLNYYIQELNVIWCANECSWMLAQNKAEQFLLESGNFPPQPVSAKAVTSSCRVSLF